MTLSSVLRALFQKIARVVRLEESAVQHAASGIPRIFMLADEGLGGLTTFSPSLWQAQARETAPYDRRRSTASQ
ncbi:hypothetical protein [Zymobacter palmae]|uniref:Deoxyxylulose-5-phosphate synthase n=1 Tax=Zymobacter palmae TaxID=33074 RepID=A0A348HCS4_9GAMM|nr:hypothetical protein [Zymobacter palmae]BBG29426.1 deoxyxylulose-5-phosphate synthase [Zymobacter palmae]